MLQLDIVFVTYQSEKWIENCIRSIVASNYDLRRVNLYFVDNASTDRTLEKLEKSKSEKGGLFGSFVIERNRENLGFGKGNNYGVRLGQAPYVFFLNIDTEVFPDTLSTLSNQIKQDESTEFALWELRQMPYEHPKNYDILTGETSWSSGAAFVMRREVFERVGGFDEGIFMYGEDVDLSWRVRAEGLKLRYVPKAAVIHHSYCEAGKVKPNQYIYSAVYNQLLRRKFGTWKDCVEGYLWMVLKCIKGADFPHSRIALIQAYVRNMYALRQARKWRRDNLEKLSRQNYTFYGFNYELERVGAFVSSRRPRTEKKVSVIVRTCGRPSVLRETLLSLRAQTYPNIEVVIVEDGPNVSERMILSEFQDMNIIYQATGEKRGRCVNGNIAMQLATGDYLNFLDDDDLLFADHVETLVDALERSPQYHIAYSMGFETLIEVHSKEPYSYTIRDIRTTCSAEFDLQELLYHNIAPIQAVMFERHVFKTCGGLDETLDVLEDWDMWIRYAIRYPFLFVPKTTSVYRVPADRDVNERRRNELDRVLQTVRERYKDVHCEVKEASFKVKLLSRRTNNIMFRCMRKGYHLMNKAKRCIRRRIGKTL